jgi:Acetyltransferase (GNAT) domain
MYYNVIPYSAVNREAYAALLQDCPGASVFHSLDWMPIYELLTQKKCQFLICAHEGDTLLAAMPVTVFEKFWVRAVFSSGFGAHGGPICRPGCEPQVIPGLLKSFVSHFLGPRTVLVSVQDFLGLGTLLPGCGFKAARVSTHVMSLPHSYEELAKKGKSEAKYRARKAAKLGIRTSRSNNNADFERWQQLCSANYIAHGRRPYPSALYGAVAERIQETDALRFYVAKVDDRVVGGAVLVFALQQGYYWMGATDPEFRNCGVNDLVFQTVFSEAIKEGIASFDFGPSPAGAEGLVRFKEKWGGLQRDYHQYSWESALGRMGANLVRYGRILRD